MYKIFSKYTFLYFISRILISMSHFKTMFVLNNTYITSDIVEHEAMI